ncbi:hypothetical protein [Segatella copri]|uniref:hypothetical protein n=1 Tax=Segatella copri TaxID=165179 RepID=UPI0015FB0251|nr:hypothetical protein [Segatella copri]
MWFKYGLKAQKLQKQHALNQRSPAEGKGKGQKLQKQHALKGQKLLAQGIALGIMAISKAPCKGKSFVYCQVFESFCPYYYICTWKNKEVKIFISANFC